MRHSLFHLRLASSRASTIYTRRLSSQHGIQQVRIRIQHLLGSLDALGVGFADDGDLAGQDLLQGLCDKVADLVEPFAKGFGDFVGLGVGFVGDGDGEVVDGDVFLCFCGDGDLNS